MQRRNFPVVVVMLAALVGCGAPAPSVSPVVATSASRTGSQHREIAATPPSTVGGLRWQLSSAAVAGTQSGTPDEAELQRAGRPHTSLPRYRRE